MNFLGSHQVHVGSLLVPLRLFACRRRSRTISVMTEGRASGEHHDEFSTWETVRFGLAVLWWLGWVVYSIPAWFFGWSGVGFLETVIISCLMAHIGAGLLIASVLAPRQWAETVGERPTSGGGYGLQTSGRPLGQGPNQGGSSGDGRNRR